MTIPPEKARLLEEIASVLARVTNVEAVALGGSYARGTHGPDSDLDIGIYYREATPFPIADIRDIARSFSVSGSPTVTEFYEWGPYVNGGAWIDNAVCKVDFLYRNLDQLEGIVAAALRGEWTHSFDQQPPFGFRSVTTLGEIHCGQSLYDPANVLGPLKNDVALFPPALKTRIIRDSFRCAEFSFQSARVFGSTSDLPYLVACMTRIYHYLVQMLFALNETYFMNDKRVLKEIEAFAKKPADFGARVSAILAAPGDSAEKLGASLGKLEKLFAETVALAGGDYAPKFPAT